MYKSLALLGALAVGGCFPHNYVPEETVLREVEREPYHRKHNNCLLKALKYQNHLTENGYEAYVTPIRLHGRLHAIVRVYNEKTDTWHEIDPTNPYNTDGAIWIKEE